MALKSIKNEKILPTPLSIKDFAVASFDIEKEEEMKEKIEEKSKETAKAFADEIKNMTDDKILFLSFLFIRTWFEVEFVRVTYPELVKELNLKDAWEFDRILNWFKDDKINISDKRIEFSHPSYSEALPYLLVEDGYITRINREIFSKLLLKLSEKDDAAMCVALAVGENFDRLPEDVRNLLFKLSEKDDATASGVAWAVAYNYDKLPEDVRDLLFKLAEKDRAWTTWSVAFAVTDNFDKLPENVRNKLLLKLSEKDEAAEEVAEAVAYNYDKLPENVRNLLDRLQKSLQQGIEGLSRSEEREDKERALHLISNALPKIDHDFVLKMLNELSGCEDETVRIKAAKMLKDIFDDSEAKKDVERRLKND